MKKLVFVVSTLTISLTACIREEGKEVVRKIELDSFDQIEIAGSFETHIRQGEKQEIIVIGHQNIIDRLQKDVSDEKWKIKLEAGAYHPNVELEFFITLPEIEAVELSGSGEVDIENVTTKNDLDLSISGSGNLVTNEVITVEQNLNVSLRGSGNMVVQANCENAISSISGSGGIYLEGKSIREDLIISGSGDYGSSDFESENTSVEINGSGSATVFTTKTLDVNINGSGSVYYSGNPEVEVSGSGAGSVHSSF